jgi:hypothetical protein
MDYTNEELLMLAYVPQMVGTAVASAGRSGLFGTGREMFAAGSALMDGVKAHPDSRLIATLFPDVAADREKALEQARAVEQFAKARIAEKKVETAEGFESLVLADAKAAMALLQGRVSAQEAGTYRQWVLEVADRVANAAREGGFLGFGGERVSPAEVALIDKLKLALGPG